MTTQDAGRQAADKSGAGPIDVDPLAQEAERLASLIRPAWEVDLSEGENEAPPAAAQPLAGAKQATVASGALSHAAEPTPAKEPNEAEKANFDRIAERLSQSGLDPAATSSNPPLAPPRDTVIEGVPTVGVGERTSTDGAMASAIAQGIAIVDRGARGADGPQADNEAPVAGQVVVGPAPPRRAGPTKLGLGDGVAEIVAAAAASQSALAQQGTAEPRLLAPPVIDQQLAAAPAQTAAPAEGHGQSVALAASKAQFSGTVRMDSSAFAGPPAGAPRSPRAAAPAPPPVAAPAAAVAQSPAWHQPAPRPPEGASDSRADDPIEIPVQKGGKMILVLLGLAVAILAVVGGVMLLGGDSSKDKKTTSAAEPDKTTITTNAPTAAAQATSTATADGSQSAIAAASSEPAATASSTAVESAAATPARSATAEPAATTASSEPSSKPPSHSAAASTGKPPSTSKTSTPKSPGTSSPKGPRPSGSGGIIRTTPF